MLAIGAVAGFAVATWPMPAGGPGSDQAAVARAAGPTAVASTRASDPASAVADPRTAPAAGARSARTGQPAPGQPAAPGRPLHPSLVGNAMGAFPGIRSWSQAGSDPGRAGTATAAGRPAAADPAGYFDTPGLTEAMTFVQPVIPSVEPEQLTGYVWPLRGARITRWFEESDEGFIVLQGKHIHDGLDIATFCGHSVLAAHSGTVLAAGRDFSQFIGFEGSIEPYLEHLRSRGEWMSLPRVVVIDDGNGYRSVYVHLGSQSVVAGEKVKAGDVIGKEGATGHASGCHLHYSLIRMDGPLVPVVRDFVKQSHYPPYVRERIDPTRVLSFKLKGHARRIPGRNPPKVPFRYVAPAQIARVGPSDPPSTGPRPV